MQGIRRRVRSFFALQAALLLFVLIQSFVRPVHPHNAPRYYACLAAYLLFALVFAAAWWTTRKPSPYRNLWASAASLVSIAVGVYFQWLGHLSRNFTSANL